MKRVALVFWVVASACAARTAWAGLDVQPSGASIAVYDADPNHLWNRLFVAFYRQNIANRSLVHPGQLAELEWVGPDVLDPPIGYHPKFLLGDEPFGKCDRLLDEFLTWKGAEMIHNPLKRALLQRDLWAVFDVLALAGKDMSGSVSRGHPQTYTAGTEAHRAKLERKLAQVIHSLALSRDEIETLPDTYDAAVKSRAFSDVPATNRYDYLPHDLFAPDSAWREIQPGSSHPMLQHGLVSGGRSLFRTFIRLPAGANDKAILGSVLKHANRGLGRPCFGLPDDTQFALVREMICLDQNEQMVATHVVESVELQGRGKVNFFREVELSRALLFQSQAGGLRSVSKGERRGEDFATLGSVDDDIDGNGPSLRKFPGNCIGCHSFINNQIPLLAPASAFITPRRSASVELIATWKERTGKLNLLRELIASSDSERK